MAQEPQKSVIEGPTVAHLGVGAFHRAHQAWYTHRAAAAAAAAAGESWGIAAFTGRSVAQAQLLRTRRGHYTLITRAAGGDAYEQIDSIRAVHDGADRSRWDAAIADPQTHIVTLTITEAGYCRDLHGRLDVKDGAVQADLNRVVRAQAKALTTAPVRLAVGLAARRAAGDSPLTIISCDNLSRNGEVTRAVVMDAAAIIDGSLPEWIDAHVAFLSSMVDRITPRTTAEDIEELRQRTGIFDEGAVVTEPFSEWVIEDGFAGPRPAWEEAGARLTTQLHPFEERKLRILNGAHSLLAYQGLLRGFADVATAFADPQLRDLVENYWSVAADSCSLPSSEIERAIAATRERFANARIRHQLAQIAQDGALKLPQRIVPVLAHAVRSGMATDVTASAIAAWVAYEGRGSADIENLLLGVGDAHISGREPATSRMLALIEQELRRLEGDPRANAHLTGAVRS